MEVTAAASNLLKCLFLGGLYLFIIGLFWAMWRQVSSAGAGKFERDKSGPRRRDRGMAFDRIKRRAEQQGRGLQHVVEVNECQVFNIVIADQPGLQTLRDQQFKTRHEDSVKLDMPNRIAFIYSELACLVDFLAQTYGMADLRKFMTLLLHRHDPDAVFKEVFHREFEAFVTDFRTAACREPR